MMEKYIKSSDAKEYLKRAIFGADQKIDKWIDTIPAADVTPADREGKEALRIVRKIGGDGKVPTLPVRLRMIVQEQRMGVYTPGQRATIWEAAELMEEAAALCESTPAARCGPDEREVIYPDDDMTRRSGLLEDD